jgi:hypothetical protein
LKGLIQGALSAAASFISSLTLRLETFAFYAKVQCQPSVFFGMISEGVLAKFLKKFP